WCSSAPPKASSTPAFPSSEALPLSGPTMAVGSSFFTGQSGPVRTTAPSRTPPPLSRRRCFSSSTIYREVHRQLPKPPLVHSLREHARPGECLVLLGQLKEACSKQRVENRGALMTNIFQDAATGAKRPLGSQSRPRAGSGVG